MKYLLVLFIVIGSINPSHAQWAVFDAQNTAETVKVLSEAKKQTETAKGVLDKSTEIMDGVDDFNTAIGKPTKITSKAFDWINQGSDAINNAAQACGIDATLPTLSGINIPGLDLGDIDFSCAKSAIEAVKQGLFTYKKLKDADGIPITFESQLKRIHDRKYANYQPQSFEEAEENRKKYKKTAIIGALSTATRAKASGKTQLDQLNKVMSAGGAPSDLSNLMRTMIATQAQTNKLLAEQNQILAAQLDLDAALHMSEIPPEEETDAQP